MNRMKPLRTLLLQLFGTKQKGLRGTSSLLNLSCLGSGQLMATAHSTISNKAQRCADRKAYNVLLDTNPSSHRPGSLDSEGILFSAWIWMLHSIKLMH